MSTKPCPQCGSSVPLQARFCGQCGFTFAAPTLDEATRDPAPAAPQPQGGIGMATVLGIPAVSATPARSKELERTSYDPNPYGAQQEVSQRPTPLVPPEMEPKKEQFGKTLLLGGVSAADLLPPEVINAPTAKPPALQTEPRPEQSPLSHSVFTTTPQERQAVLEQPIDKRTMLGMPAVALPPPSAKAPEPQLQQPSSAAQAFPPAMKTMLGVAMPGIAPTRENVPPAQPEIGSKVGTLLGVAVPGIAPLRPGIVPTAALPQMQAPAPSPPPPPIVPAPAPLVHEPIPDSPVIVAKKGGVPAVAVVLIVFFLVAIVGGGGAFLILRQGAPLTAQPQLDDSGKESLKIHCESCADGTIVSLGASQTTVTAASAVLALPAPLSIGENDLEVKIQRPAPGRTETVKIHVPVAYRVKADLTTLPTVTVRVEATAGTEVLVEGKPVSLDASNKGTYAIDVSAETAGPSDDQKTIDRKIPFSIKPKGGKAEDGQLIVRAVVAPLHLDAPGRELYTAESQVAIAGQTKAGGTVTIDGANAPLDATGHFAVKIDIADGTRTIKITAGAPPFAPRTVMAKVTHVSSLDMAGKTLDGEAPLAFDAVAADPAANVGKLVAIDGDVLDARPGQGHIVILVEEKKACSTGSCLARIVHGEETKIARGDGIRAYGHVVGTVTANGKASPDIEGVLVIARPKAKK